MQYTENSIMGNIHQHIVGCMLFSCCAFRCFFFMQTDSSCHCEMFINSSFSFNCRESREENIILWGSHFNLFFLKTFILISIIIIWSNPILPQLSVRFSSCHLLRGSDRWHWCVICDEINGFSPLNLRLALWYLKLVHFLLRETKWPESRKVPKVTTCSELSHYYSRIKMMADRIFNTSFLNFTTCRDFSWFS